MRVGLIAAATDRGLGNQCREVYRHIRPDVTVVVDPGPHRRPLMPVHPEWYPDGHLIEWTHEDSGHGRLPGALELLSTCDVVYSAETYYDWSLPAALEKRGVATVLHTNPELYTGEKVSAIWLPTRWLSDRFHNHRIVPMPAPVHYFPEVKEFERPFRIVHPAGVGAAGDRNGTIPFAKIAPLLSKGGYRVDMTGPNEEVLGNKVRSVDDWWTRDPGAAVSVIPRRYGGLCLPAMEALCAGVPVVMPDIAPQNRDWPIVPVPHRKARDIRLKGGLIPQVFVAHEQVYQTVTRLLGNPNRLGEERERARAWAVANSWDALLPRWMSAFEDAATLHHG